MMKISAVVAMAANHVIGKDNQLPWRLPEDLKRFKAITTGHPILMGRKTFESIGRILPNRLNIIISRQANYQVPGEQGEVQLVHSLQEGLACCDPLTTNEVFIIGGAEIYRLAFPLLDRIYLTLIHQEIEGDTFFPSFSSAEFREVMREDRPGERKHLNESCCRGPLSQQDSFKCLSTSLKEVPSFSFLVLDRVQLAR